MLEHPSGPNHNLIEQAMTDSNSTRKRRPEDNRARIESPSKYCAKCGETKDKSEFSKQPNRADGLRAYCRPCKAKESREYRERNPEASLEATRRWARVNKERKAETNKLWVSNNRDWVNKRAKRWADRNKKKLRHCYHRRQRDLTYRLNHTLSTRIYSVLKGKLGRRTKEILGYTTQELIAHIEKQFTFGMTWDNYGEWHLDHIKPLASFIFSGPEDPEVRRAWGLPNLRPLWAIENRKKHCAITHLI